MLPRSLTYATTAVEAERLAREIQARAPRRAEDRPTVSFLVRHHTGAYADDSRRTMDAVAWAGIRRNYPPRVAASLDALMAAHRPAGGKIVLWHGAPGAGKTTALRALLTEWARWCRPQYVADPERLFASSAYLSEVTAETEPGQWNLVIAEDSDEFLRASARQRAGAALGRLLNFADGFLGQSSNTLVLLTTNEPVSSLHPAVVRPGRCLTEIEFTAFTPAQAHGWLPAGVPAPGHDATLAQLLELRGDLRRLDTSTPTRAEHGLYL